MDSVVHTERTDSARDSNDHDHDSNDHERPYYQVLVSTLDASTRPVLFFPYPSFLQTQRACPPGYQVRRVPLHDTTSSVRLGYAFVKRYMYNAMRNVFKAAHLQKRTTTSHAATSWNVFWGDHLKSAEFAALLPHQRVNHFPGSLELGRKDRLCANVLRLRKKHPDAYRGILPETYLTANDYDKQQFLIQYAASPHTLWILKPPNLSCGRGIKIVAAATTPTLQLPKKKAYVAQQYVVNPFLIHELKFDLRIYVAVTSFDPLRIYLYDDGLVRFCTEKYSTSRAGLKNQFGHLTNYSVNKKNAGAFQPNLDHDHGGIGDGDDEGENDDDEKGDSGASCPSSSKWSLQSFYKYLTEQGKATELATFQHALEDLIVKTLIAVESKILMMTPASGPHASGSNGFELYGFDVLLEDEALKPWLLEVNVFPSLSSSSPMDKRIKTMLVSDLFQLVGVPFQDASTAADQAQQFKRERLLGVGHRRHSGTDTTTSKKMKKKRTVDELIQSDESAVLADLDATDLRIVHELEEEDARRGHFKRIFPTADSWRQYGSLFETQRYKNVLCMRWLDALAHATPVRRRASAVANNRRSSTS